ncbi:MAG TPA: hypothetical protein VGM53_17090 [Streptosporangiaceae bacterium]|jgi:integrase
MLREADLHLPKKGWGRIDLAGSASRAGTAWTDHGTAHETRTIPIPTELVRLLRANIKRYGTTHDGRIFHTARGGILQGSGYVAELRGARDRGRPPGRARRRGPAVDLRLLHRRVG